MLHAIKHGGEGRRGGGAGAIAQSRQAQSQNTQHQRVGACGNEDGPGGADGEAIGKEHGLSPAQRVKGCASDHPAQAIADGQNAHQGGGQPSRCPHRQGQVPGKADHGAAHS